MKATRFTELVGVRHPLIQAPMAGGPTTPELVAAVCNEGALGSIAAAALAPGAILAAARDVRALTSAPFNINLFVLDTPAPDAAQIARAVTLLAPLRIRLGLPEWRPPERYCEDFAAQLVAVCACAPALASFTFGILNGEQVAALHAVGSLVMGTATNAAEARAWEAVGADLVCAQGGEAGGHRGTFIGRCEDNLTGLMAMLPQLTRAVRIPVVAAGGIMSGQGIAAALTLGAAAAQLGTAFLTTPEANLPPVYRTRLLAAAQDETCVTRAFSGRHARGMRNEFIDKFAIHADEVPAYPVQNALTAQIRAAAARAGDGELMSMWAGQGVALCRELPAAELVRVLMQELAVA